MRTREAAVRTAFRAQKGWCEKLGSPFTARLCDVFAERLDRSTALGRRMLDWPGEPDALHDSVPLRIAGGLHALVRRGRLPDLAAFYPPGALPEPNMLWQTVSAALAEAGDEVEGWLDLPPQTNEVARSAVLMSGYVVVASRTGLPLSLFELGASAGLNLLADRYACRLGSRLVGPCDSAVRLEPAWTGPDLPAATPVIARRRGVDLNPLDVTTASDRERMAAYVWPDQSERLARLEAALAIAVAEPPTLDRGDAGDWLEWQLASQPTPGLARVVAHSVAFQYFPAATQRGISALIEEAGEAATSASPLAWLRYETDSDHGGRTTLRLRLWPDGDDALLAFADPHARSVHWQG
ncbi:DUF2332 domain-containing protein [uncultured Enterovirga sp.]|uniref:DUF2332 domain-containing protein n=1 Tax=uncultured Enterovirga sp. TaxID=2026352 RepID=UPI0035CBC69E